MDIAVHFCHSWLYILLIPVSHFLVNTFDALIMSQDIISPVSSPLAPAGRHILILKVNIHRAAPSNQRPTATDPAKIIVNKLPDRGRSPSWAPDGRPKLNGRFAFPRAVTWQSINRTCFVKVDKAFLKSIDSSVLGSKKNNAKGKCE